MYKAAVLLSAPVAQYLSPRKLTPPNQPSPPLSPPAPTARNLPHPASAHEAAPPCNPPPPRCDSARCTTLHPQPTPPSPPPLSARRSDGPPPLSDSARRRRLSLLPPPASRLTPLCMTLHANGALRAVAVATWTQHRKLPPLRRCFSRFPPRSPRSERLQSSAGLATVLYVRYETWSPQHIQRRKNTAHSPLCGTKTTEKHGL